MLEELELDDEEDEDEDELDEELELELDEGGSDGWLGGGDGVFLPKACNCILVIRHTHVKSVFVEPSLFMSFIRHESFKRSNKI